MGRLDSDGGKFLYPFIGDVENIGVGEDVVKVAGILQDQGFKLWFLDGLQKGLEAFNFAQHFIAKSGSFGHEAEENDHN